MKKTPILLWLLVSSMIPAVAQVSEKAVNPHPARPKLVVGIVVDQMRWDYLYRYNDLYTSGGFRRLLDEGFSCENTMIDYLPAFTGVGHSTIFTGSVPSIHGIAGNEWIDYKTGKHVYCTDDESVSGVGASGRSGKMSPRNLLATTITDELRLATNFRSKVVGISLKDRASILPAGHNPTAAFWLDDASGFFISSSYYMNELPDWVNAFNKAGNISKLLSQEWNTLLPAEKYIQSTPDNENWEGNLAGSVLPVFPYDVIKAYETNHASLRQMPYGNTLTLRFAEAAVNGYGLGHGTDTDFLTINCASTDYAGHLTGVNSIETEDVYLRLDRDLSEFFTFLDANVGKGNYLVFLTADHGAAHAEGFMKAHNMPTGLLAEPDPDTLEALLDQQFNSTRLLMGIENFQVFLNINRIDSLKLDPDKVKQAALDYLRGLDGIQDAVDLEKAAVASIPASLREMMINGYNHRRSGCIQLIPMPGWLPSESVKGTTHGVWNPYDTHIPLVFMGWKIRHGSSNHPVHMTDIAPTLAALLHIQMPDGCIGKPITDLTDR